MDEDVGSSQAQESSSAENEESKANADEDSDDNANKFPNKKLKTEHDSLEERLTGILCCAVCLDLPKTAVFQCRNGHLMCSECFNHLLADAQLRLGNAVCPSCRTLISKDLCVRNLVVEKAVSELPIVCQQCSEKLPRCLRQAHDQQLCIERHVNCCYHRIGCPWFGPFKKKIEHEKRCAQPKKNGAEIKQAVPKEFSSDKTEDLNKLCKFLSCEKFAFNDLQLMGPYHTDEYFIRYETFRFCAFGIEWEVRAHVNDNEADPTMSCERKLSYQLLLKENVRRPINLFYTVVRGPFGEMKVRPKIESFKFSDATPESHYAQLALEDSIECYRLLSGTIRFRLIMFCNGLSFEGF